jgi:disulfide bond formation protein DsbB
MTPSNSAGPGGRRLGVIALLCVAAVGAALVSQHAFGMEPCPWCILQRTLLLAIALVAAVGAFARRGAGHAVAAVLVVLLALSGIASALWQHFYAAPSGSCNLTLADRILNALGLPSLLPDVFSPRATCADAAVDLLGVSYDFWSLALFVLVGVLAISALARPAPAARSLARRGA